MHLLQACLQATGESLQDRFSAANLVETKCPCGDRTGVAIPVRGDQQSGVIVILYSVIDHPFDRIKQVLAHLIHCEITKIDELYTKMLHEKQEFWR